MKKMLKIFATSFCSFLLLAGCSNQIQNPFAGSIEPWNSQIIVGDVDQAPNRALYKYAIQSSTYPDANASRAVDGNTDGNYFNNSVSHTGYDAGAWWMVDLGGLYTIDSVKIWNRTDCCPERLTNFYIQTSTDANYFENTWTMTGQCSTPSKFVYYLATNYANTKMKPAARYIRVQLAGSNYLALAEVKVFGSPAQIHGAKSFCSGVNSGDRIMLSGGLMLLSSAASGYSYWTLIESAPTAVAIATTPLSSPATLWKLDYPSANGGYTLYSRPYSGGSWTTYSFSVKFVKLRSDGTSPYTIGTDGFIRKYSNGFKYILSPTSTWAKDVSIGNKTIYFLGDSKDGSGNYTAWSIPIAGGYFTKMGTSPVGAALVVLKSSGSEYVYVANTSSSNSILQWKSPSWSQWPPFYAKVYDIKTNEYLGYLDVLTDPVYNGNEFTPMSEFVANGSIQWAAWSLPVF